MTSQRDPVCGMTVDDATSVTATVDGERHSFCSTACRDRFTGNPAAFAAGSGGTPMERHEPPRSTTGGFSAPRSGSAGSGGMESGRRPEARDDRSDRHR